MTPAELRILTALLEVPGGATREHLVRKADIGTTTFYRLVRPLLEQGIVEQHDSRYVLPLSHPYNFRFKMWQDMERLYRLPPADRQEVLDVARSSRLKLKDDLLALWLTGSAAQDKLGPDSDFDFLAVTRTDTLYHPKSRRDINFVQMTEQQFNERLDEDDYFIVDTLRHGIILQDRDWMQTIYASPHRLAVTPSSTLARHEQLKQSEDRFHFFLRHEQLDEAIAALQSITISTTWTLLKAMQVAPPHKSELPEACRQLFGDHLANFTRTILVKAPSQPKRLVALHRELDEYRDRFEHQQSHLTSFARLPTASALELEELTAAVLRELMPGTRILSGPQDPFPGDVAALGPDGTAHVLVACVSLVRTMEHHHLTSLVEKVRAIPQLLPQSLPHARLVVVANLFRELPALEQPAIPSVLLDEARHLDPRLVLLTGRQLLQAHNRLHLDPTPRPQPLLAELLHMKHEWSTASIRTSRGQSRRARANGTPS